jgi:ribosomal protein S18 acetylase RimI-like enzyme
MALRRVTPAEYATMTAMAAADYAARIVASGMLPPQEAARKARDDYDRALPAGLDTPGQLIFRVLADGEPVGWLWIGVPGPDGNPEMAWVYLVQVDEPFRGRGYGREAMRLAEDQARASGMRSLGLNVHGGNTVARSLYTGMGYEVMAQQMKKAL